MQPKMAASTPYRKFMLRRLLLGWVAGTAVHDPFTDRYDLQVGL
jgi:hypothetical protein